MINVQARRRGPRHHNGRAARSAAPRDSVGCRARRRLRGEPALPRAGEADAVRVSLPPTAARPCPAAAPPRPAQRARSLFASAVPALGARPREQSPPRRDRAARTRAPPVAAREMRASSSLRMRSSRSGIRGVAAYGGRCAARCGGLSVTAASGDGRDMIPSRRPPALGRSREVEAWNTRGSKPRPLGPRQRALGPGPAPSDHWRRSKSWIATHSASTRRLRRSTTAVKRARESRSRYSRLPGLSVCSSRRAAPPFTAPCTTHNREVGGSNPPGAIGPPKARP
jgi:hypothetical protein